MTEGADSEGRSRREIATLLFGVVASGAVLQACAGREDEDPTTGRQEQPLAGTSFLWVDRIGTAPVAAGATANLRGQSGGATAGKVAIVAGFAGARDGGGGVFVWDTTSAVDDGGTVIVYNQSAGSTTPGACWRRIYSGPINVKWFGAVGNGTVLDTDAFDRALSTAGSGGCVLVPPGIYHVGPLAPLTSDRQVVGTSRRHCILRQASASAPLLSTTASLLLSELCVDGNKSLFQSSAATRKEAIRFDGTSGSLNVERCVFRATVAAAVFALNVSNRFTVVDCEFLDIATSISGDPSYPYRGLAVYVKTGATGNVVVSRNTFVQSSILGSPLSPGGVQIEGSVPPAPGSSVGLSASICDNYFEGLGSVGEDGSGIGAVDLYKYVGKAIIANNRFSAHTGASIKVANGTAVEILGNVICDQYWSHQVACIFYSGAARPTDQQKPYHDVIVANNIVRSAAGSFGIHLVGDPAGLVSRRHVVQGNIIESIRTGVYLDGVADVNLYGNTVCNWLSGTVESAGAVCIVNCQKTIRIADNILNNGEMEAVPAVTQTFPNIYSIIAQTNCSQMELSITDNVFVCIPNATSQHIYVTSANSVHISGNRMRGAAGPMFVAITGTAYVNDNMSDSSAATVSAGTVLSRGNSWSPA